MIHKDIQTEISYHKDQLAAWQKNQALFGDKLPECKIKIAYHTEMLETIIPEWEQMQKVGYADFLTSKKAA